MASKRRTHTAEFKAASVRLVREGGLSVRQAARKQGISRSLLTRWIDEARAGDPDRTRAELLQERRELLREKERLDQEIAILRKAAEYLARDEP